MAIFSSVSLLVFSHILKGFALPFGTKLSVRLGMWWWWSGIRCPFRHILSIDKVQTAGDSSQEQKNISQTKVAPNKNRLLVPPRWYISVSFIPRVQNHNTSTRQYSDLLSEADERCSFGVVGPHEVTFSTRGFYL